MPELPEVETIKLGLSKLIVGLEIRGISSDNPKSFQSSESDITNFIIKAKIIDIRRRAKALLIELSSKYTLAIHLKMTGQLVYIGSKKRYGGGHPSDSLINSLPDKSTRVTITFNNGGKLFFNDQRKFGWIRLIPTDQINYINFFNKLGPEPLDNTFTWRILKDRLRLRKNSTIKSVLLDQSIVAGIGNIYADESLWGAKIHPAKLVKYLKSNEYINLHKEIIYVLNLSIEKGGSSDKNYVDADGKKGSYLTFSRVFRREGQICPRCDHLILKTRVASRGTHYCPYCQRLPRKPFK